MTDLVLNHMTNGNNISVANNNFDKIQDNINNTSLQSIGGNNILGQDLDFDGNDLLNGGALSGASLTLNGFTIIPTQIEALDPAILAVLLHSPPPIGDVTPNFGAFSNLQAVNLTTSSITNSTSPTTGSVKIAGGVGIGGDIYCAGSYHGAAFITAGTINSTPIGATVANTGKFTTIQGTDTTNATTTTTGGLVLAGGIGIAKDIFCGGGFHGAIAALGGTVDNIVIGGTTPAVGIFTTLKANDATNSTSASTGAVQTLGGIGVAKDIFIGGNITVAGSATGNVFKGRFIGTKVITATGTYTPTVGTATAIVECIGGGAGGGPTTATGASQSSAAAGGGSGSYAKVLWGSPTSQTVTIGAGGASGAVGGQSSVGALVVCPGGNASGTAPVSGSAGFNGGGLPTSLPTLSGVTLIEQQAGSAGYAATIMTPGAVSTSGYGAVSKMGSGGRGITGPGAGGAGSGYGSGGAGGNTPTASSAAQNGGAGAPGLVVIYEYT